MNNSLQDRQRWEQYRRTGSAALREAIIKDYAILARRAVERLQITPWGCVSMDDLLGSAALGLLDAVDRYDPAYGIPFEGFAMPRIRGAVLDSLRQLDWAPRSVRSQESALKRAYARIEERNGRPATNSEVAEELGIDEEELDCMLADVSRCSLLSLDDMVAGADDGATLGDLTPDTTGEDPFSHRERHDARARLASAIAALPEREKTVISLYYLEELTLKEIGRVLSVSEQRVSQIHSRAILRMSNKLQCHQDLLMSLAA